MINPDLNLIVFTCTADKYSTSQTMQDSGTIVDLCKKPHAAALPVSGSRGARIVSVFSEARRFSIG